MRAMLQRFMYGRYGVDQLSWCLLGVYLLVYLLAAVTDLSLLFLLSAVCMFLALFRMLSHNLPRRREENARFLRQTAPLVRRIKLAATVLRDRDHRYFKCPNCSQQLRVPKGKGKITITCRSCGVTFEKKT